MPYKDVETDRAYNRNRRAWLKEHGICTDCGSNYCEPGHVYCKACGVKRKQRNDAYYSIVSKTERMKALRHARISQGLCGDCGKPAEAGRPTCPRCRARRRESAQVARIRNRIKRETEANVATRHTGGTANV